MIQRSLLTIGLAASLALPGWVQATPEDDLKAFRDFYAKRFPKVEFAAYVDGAYALDPIARQNWEAIEEFPPYEMNLEEGRKLFEAKFKNGTTLADCFPNGGVAIKQNYPYFDKASGEVRTLEQDINACREKNGEEAWPLEKGKLASVVAHMAYTSRGKIIDVKIPDDPKALQAYEEGKQFFYAKRGQLNFSCADCHVQSGGLRLRSELLSPALGHTTHFPVYRAEWGEMGTLHRRYVGCNEQVRAKAFKPQSREYRNLEYFHSYMSNGLEINGPGARK